MDEQKGAFRLTITMFLLLGLVGLVADAGNNQEQKIKRLIKQLQDQNPEVCASTVGAL